MDFESYKTEHFHRYNDFAEVVRSILNSAIEENGGPRPQSIQFRAKDPASLEKRLAEAKKLDSKNIESERHDLAGVRIIFYTSTEVDRFIASRIVRENFDVESESIKVHHPTKENNDSPYRATHYTVRLKESRTALPEYAKFAGMRCEIQVHTILNHAWAEIGHDIIYKNETRENFGNKSLAAIERRLNRVARQYLIPAEYELKRVQHDYERLTQGKQLFDTDILTSLDQAPDNNERHQLLESLRNDVLPHYDDHAAIYNDLVKPLLDSVEAAKITPLKPRSTAIGELEGKTSEDVTVAVVEVFSFLRFADVARTFNALIELYRKSDSDKARGKIIELAKSIAAYDIEVWDQVGAGVQAVIIDQIEELNGAQRVELRNLLIPVLEAILNPEITGTSWNVDTVTFQTGAVPISNAVSELREKAMSSLFELFTASSNDSERLAVINALEAATRTPYNSNFSNELLAVSLNNTKRIVEFVTASASKLSYELKQTLENRFLHDYHRAWDIADDPQDKFKSKSQAQALLSAIEQFRDLINQDNDFVRHKMLVGFETVLPEQWEDRSIDYTKLAERRRQESDAYISQINDDNEKQWFAFFERCASTVSNDMATFPTLIRFLGELAAERPDVAKRLLETASKNIFGFLPAILGGLRRSAKPEFYSSFTESFIESGEHLFPIARFLRTQKPLKPDYPERLLQAAFRTGDDHAVLESVLTAMELTKSDGLPSEEKYFIPAFKHLNSKNDHRWINAAHFFGEPTEFFQNLSEQNARLILDNLLLVQRIDFQHEQVLTWIAEKFPELVWDYFGKRIQIDAGKEKPKDFQPVPYKLQYLHKPLAKNVKLAIAKARELFGSDSSPMFRFRGGKLLATVFPLCGKEFATQLEELINAGAAEDAIFAVRVMDNYKGQGFTHSILKSILARHPGNDDMSGRVMTALMQSGVVHGEYGFVESHRQKKEILVGWLQDERAGVRDFAEKQIRVIDLWIADEQRRADEQKRMYELQFDSEKADKDEQKSGGEDSEPEEPTKH